jgi:hypothetical protein
VHVYNHTADTLSESEEVAQLRNYTKNVVRRDRLKWIMPKNPNLKIISIILT